MLGGGHQAALIARATVPCAAITAAQTLGSPMKPSLAVVFARKGDSKIAFNYLDAYKVH